MVSTTRCGRVDPGSIPGGGIDSMQQIFFATIYNDLLFLSPIPFNSNELLSFSGHSNIIVTLI